MTSTREANKGDTNRLVRKRVARDRHDIITTCMRAPRPQPYRRASNRTTKPAHRARTDNEEQINCTEFAGTAKLTQPVQNCKREARECHRKPMLEISPGGPPPSTCPEWTGRRSRGARPRLATRRSASLLNATPWEDGGWNSGNARTAGKS